MRDLPIRQKMILVILAASVLTLVATILAVLIYEQRTYKPESLEDLSATAELLSENLDAPLNFLRPEDANQALQALKHFPSISVACVYDVDRREFARYPTTDGDETGAGTAAEVACPPLPEIPDARFGPAYLDYFTTIDDDDERAGYLYLRREIRPLLARVPEYGIMAGAVLFALLAVSLLLLYAFRPIISDPILELAHAAQKVKERQDYGIRVAERGRDEIGYLTDAFNDMLATIDKREAELRQAGSEQRSLQQQLVQAQKMESIGRLAGGVAHDFNNLLTVIVGSADLTLRQLPSSSPLQPVLANLKKATSQATELTGRLLAFARKQVIEPRVLNLNELVLDAEKMLRTLIGEDVELVVIPPADTWPVKADPNQLMQVLVNLVVNARDAMPQGGTLSIGTRNLVVRDADRSEHPGVEPGDWVTLQVTDTGVGLSIEARAHLFEPFFTTKPRGKGTGLGLATCYGIVKQSGGHIGYRSQEGRGTTFTVYLRRTKEAAKKELESPTDVTLMTGEETVLVVEDNSLVRQTAVELLRAQGYTVLEAASGADAIRLVTGFEDEIHLLITDIVMPQMSGQEVAEKLRDLRPDLRILYVSAYTADSIIREEDLRADAFLQKPYTSEALMRKVRAVLDAESPRLRLGSVS